MTRQEVETEIQRIESRTTPQSITPRTIVVPMRALLDYAAGDAQISDIQNRLKALEGQTPDREVVPVETVEDLYLIDNPNLATVYIVNNADNPRIYLYDGTDFIEQTGTPTADDRTIITTSWARLFNIIQSGELENGTYTVQIIAPIKSQRGNAQVEVQPPATLFLPPDWTKAQLHNAQGYADINESLTGFSWHYYAYTEDTYIQFTTEQQALDRTQTIINNTLAPE